MNREILFRGKRVDNGEWAYWNQFGKYTEPQQIGNGIWNHADDTYIDPDTVGQYIGKPDINDKKIFEGDIILINHREWLVEEREIVKVKWCGNDGYPAFDIPNSSTSEDCNGLSLINNCEGYSAEIIGNIYDNSELLEAKP